MSRLIGSALLATVALGLLPPAPVQAQNSEPPPSAQGPFLLHGNLNGGLSLVSVSSRRETALGASATVLLFSVSMNIITVTRAQYRVEADCSRRVLRGGPTRFYQDGARDFYVDGYRPSETVTGSRPAIDIWVPIHPNDPLGPFLCDGGRVDAARVRPAMTTFVTDWLTTKYDAR